MLNWFKFYIYYDLPTLFKQLIIRGGALVLFMMVFEFIGALLGGHNVNVAIEWSLDIVWPSFKAAFILVVILGLFLRGLSKRDFLKKVYTGDCSDPKEAYMKWLNWGKCD